MQSCPVILCPVAWNQTGAVAEAEQGLRLAKEGKYDLAAARYKSALSKNPRLPGVYLNLGLALFKLDRLAEAVPAFEKALKADPGSFQTRVLLNGYYGTRKFSAAAATLKPAVAQQPDNTELRYKLAQSLMWSQQYEPAGSKNFESSSRKILIRLRSTCFLEKSSMPRIGSMRP